MRSFFPHLLLLLWLLEQSDSAELDMWDILQENAAVRVVPENSSCKAGETFCVPNPPERQIATNTDQSCLPALCSPENANISSAMDGSLRTSFVSKNVDTLDLIVEFPVALQIFYIRLAFSANPPNAISIQHKTSQTSQWLPWQYFSTDCQSSFGIAAAFPQSQISTSILCATLPWSAKNYSAIDSVVWSVLGGRSGVATLDNNTLLQDFSSAQSIRITLSGHAVHLPPSATTSYGSQIYGIAELSVYGRCGPFTYRSPINSQLCLPCNCSTFGALNPTCSPLGICQCRPNFSGSTCHSCSPGYFNQTLGCTKCSCDPLGTDICSNTTGQCVCRAGFVGQDCGSCGVGTYLLGHLCAPCDACHRAGTVAGVCDRDGTCLCKRFVSGNRCELCLPDFVDLSAENPNGCTLKSVQFVQTLASDTDFSALNQTLSPRSGSGFFPTSTMTSDLNSFSTDNLIISLRNNSTLIPETTTFERRGFTAAPLFLGSQNMSANSTYNLFYPWLVAIIVLLVIALLVLIAHLVYCLFRRSRRRTYSPRQVPDFLSMEHASRRVYQQDNFQRQNPSLGSAKLTGYFYNPEYPLQSLTPDSLRMPGVRNSNERPVDVPPAGRNGLDLSRNPPSTGLLPYRPRAAREIPPAPPDNGVSTISGGITNENFHIDDET